MKTLRLAALFFGLALVLPADGRTWTSTDGKTLEADFVKLDGAQVHLRSADGKPLIVPLSLLSAADQSFAKSQPAPAAPTTVKATPSKNPAKDAESYIGAVAKLNEEHVKKPGKEGEDDLAKKLPASAASALQSVIAAPDSAPGLAPALAKLGNAALDLSRAEDFAAVRQRLEKLDAAEAQKLGQAAFRPRLIVRAIGDFAPDYAEKFADLAGAAMAAYDETFGFAEFSKIPGKKLRFRVHLEPEIKAPPHFAPEFAWHSEVDFPVAEKDGFHSPTPNGQFLLYGLCHELGHVIAMWGDAKTMEDHHAWAHYTGVVAVEQLQKAPAGTAFLETARDLKWRSLTVERNLAENKRAPSVADKDGVMALLIALHDAVGPKAIGAAMNWLEAEGKSPRINHVRYYSLDGLKRALKATVTDAEKKEKALALFGPTGGR